MNLNHIRHPVARQYFSFVDADMIIYDVHVCVSADQSTTYC
jgi:hypothetical protein